MRLIDLTAFSVFLVSVAALAGCDQTPSVTSKGYSASSYIGTDNVYMGITGDRETKWVSEPSPAQWLQRDHGKPVKTDEIVIEWGDVYAVKYDVLVSDDGQNWKTVYTEDAGDGMDDEIVIEPVVFRYLRFSLEQPSVPNKGYEMSGFAIRYIPE